MGIGWKAIGNHLLGAASVMNGDFKTAADLRSGGPSRSNGVADHIFRAAAVLNGNYGSAAMGARSQANAAPVLRPKQNHLLQKYKFKESGPRSGGNLPPELFPHTYREI